MDAAQHSRLYMHPVAPAKAGVQEARETLDSRFRGNDVERSASEISRHSAPVCIQDHHELFQIMICLEIRPGREVWHV
jgi:hypothetical protein